MAAFDGRPSHVGRFVTVQPLFAKHYQKGGRDLNRESGEQDYLDLNHRAGRTGPLWQGGYVVSVGGDGDLVHKKAKEGDGLVVGIRLELRVELDDKCGGDRREKTAYAPI